MFTRKLAEFVVQTRYEDLPKDAKEASKDAILDCLGSILIGSQQEVSKLIVSFIKELGSNPLAGIVKGGFRTSPPLAAFANGVAAHAMEYDDFMGGYAHVSAQHLPVVLALSEICNSPGKEVLAGYILGIEVGAKIGYLLGKQNIDRGWHTTSTLGSLGAAASAARILKLNVQQTQRALGIAASLAGGLRGNFGTMTKPMHAGNAARNGIVAGLLAQKGFTADENILEKRDGFLKMFGEGTYNFEEALRKLGAPYAVLNPGIVLKLYPSCAGTHSTIDAAVQLRNEHKIEPEKIAEIDCSISKVSKNMLIYCRPQKGLEAKFSGEYCVAAALINGPLSLDNFVDDEVLNPQVQELIPKVKFYHPDEIADKPAMEDIPRRVTIKLRNGEEFSSQAFQPKGYPENRLNKDELNDKFKKLTKSILSDKEKDEVIRLVSDLESLKETKRLMELIEG